jgi:hypothetical protein
MSQVDLSPGNAIPAMLGFADINNDIDVAPGLGCTTPAASCHGTTMPSGIMQLVAMAAGNMTELMANYNQVKMQCNLSNPTQSLFLLKPLAISAGGVQHTGGNSYFMNTQNPMYQRWLYWIQLGAPFNEVSTMGDGGAGPGGG